MSSVSVPMLSRTMNRGMCGPLISGNWYSPCIAGPRSSVAVREQVCHIAAGFDYRGIYG